MTPDVERCKYPDGLSGEHFWSTTDKRPRECLWCGAQEQDLTAPPDDLVARLELKNIAAILREFGDDDRANDALEAERLLIALTAENKALREALRRVALVSGMGRGPTCDGAWGPMINCQVCRKGWYADKPERHATGCLAAGAANER